jgi:assimilatory nitrate reductase electron transfer subunit
MPSTSSPPTAAERVVIVGGGMAGTRAAQQSAGAAVTLVAEEPGDAYNRVLLADVLAGAYEPGVIALPSVRPGVRRLSGVRAVRIDRAERRVLCDDGTVLPYDRLVLATGSNPVLPPLRGLFEQAGGELPAGVHPFRTLADCRALAAAVPASGARAVVVGGGLLGVSAARALARRGAQVVLAHQGEHLMERQLDEGAARIVRTHLEGLGVEVHTECRVRGVRTAGGRVRAVEFADGFQLTADVAVLACGVRPRTGLARAAGLEVRRGVVVDDALRTSDPRVQAVGDCAEHRGTVYGLAAPALEQADAAARGARYTGTRALTRLTLAAALGGSLDLAAFGDPRPAPGDDVVRLADATRSVYRSVVVRDDRLVGGILLGDLGTVGALARAWEGDEPLPGDRPLLHLLTDTTGHGGS